MPMPPLITYAALRYSLMLRPFLLIDAAALAIDALLMPPLTRFSLLLR